MIKDLGYLQREEPIHIKFGNPMVIEGNGKDQHKFCVDFIQKYLNIWNKK
ncbi:MAG: hypothetical protein PF541_11970 [Prolixibacteraceae bacterium]|nr:hypothetical protein [Prolixibacteraceae bacterium]